MSLIPQVVGCKKGAANSGARLGLLIFDYEEARKAGISLTIETQRRGGTDRQRTKNRSLFEARFGQR